MTLDDINFYHFDRNPDFPRATFSLSVDGEGVFVIVSIPCANPGTCQRGADYGRGHDCDGEWVDRQTALDALIQFEFKTLFYLNNPMG